MSDTLPATIPGPPADTSPSTSRAAVWPVLPSAAANLIGAYLWLMTCIGVVLTAPLLVLFLFEVVYFVRAPAMVLEELDRRGRVIAAFEILIGATSALIGLLTVANAVLGLVSVVCGIVLVVRLRRYTAARRAQHRTTRPTSTSTKPP